MYESGSYTSFWAQPYVIIGLYLYFTICWYSIARKTGHPSPWWAFIPFLNMYQWVEMAHKPWYWFVFMFIPFLNIVAYAVVWYEIAKARAKAPVWGIFMILPFLNLLAVLVMAIGGPYPTSVHPHEEKKPVREQAHIEK